MTNRKCNKCGDSLTVNEKLGYMECVSGKHIEPINLITPQWWYQCPGCGVMGLNLADQEARLQNKTTLQFESQNPKPITCRACSTEFIKK